LTNHRIAYATCALGLVISVSARADTSEQMRPPPRMSYPTAAFFAKHPDAYKAFLTHLAPHAVSVPRFTTSAGGTWQQVTRAPVQLCNPLLLTDGTVIASNPATPGWVRLTPDDHGNYAKGTWTQIASLPVIGKVQYAPLYHATGLLPDGRVVIMGGEYNGNDAVWTNLGAIYDPLKDKWTPMQAPIASAWTQIGDAQSVVLADGTFMLASCCAINPAADILLDAKTLTWRNTGAPRAGNGYQDEQGYELLPGGDVLTLDIWTGFNFVKQNGTNAKNAERYNPGPGTWSSAGDTPVSLVDPIKCGNFEIGPAVLRGDGTVVAFGGNTGCIAGATNDPTAIYDSKTNSWTRGPHVPATCGSTSTTSCSLADAPAALEPDGNILFAASSGYGDNPTHFFEYGPKNHITQVSDTLSFAATSGAYYYNFLVLPNGQILSTDFSRHAEVYTPAAAPIAAWAPVIDDAPSEIVRGSTYRIIGNQLNGVSQGAYYGDDVQGATNFPIVRLSYVATGQVVYARSKNFSTMTVAPHALGSAEFSTAKGAPTGPATLQVIANGIASKPVLVTVK
jgi:hypothetical protein